MTFIEELHQLKNSIQDFNNRYADYDCTILSDDDLREALYTDFLSGRLYTGLREEYEERADRYEIEYELKMQRLRERYHYLDPDEKKFRIGFLWRANAYEEGFVHCVLNWTKDRELAKIIIHKEIPTITDAEIEEHWDHPRIKPEIQKMAKEFIRSGTV